MLNDIEGMKGGGLGCYGTDIQQPAGGEAKRRRIKN